MALKLWVSNRPEQTFDQFWAKYPRRVNRKDALKAWIQLDPDEALIQTILEALEWQVETWDDVKFIPHASTWLHKERWLDERPAVKATSLDHLPAWHRASILSGRK